MKMKLHKKITFIISIVLLAVFGLSALLLRQHIHDETLNHVVNKTEINAISVSKDISNIFENASLATQYMAFQHTIQAYLREVENRDDITRHPNTVSVFKTLKEVKDNSEHHFLVWVANEKADFYIDHHHYISGSDYHVKSRPWYPVGNNTIGVGITEPYLEWETLEMVISFVQALREDGMIYGYVAVDIILENLPNMLSKMRLTEKDYIYLITDENIYAYSSEAVQDHMTNMFEKSFFLGNKKHIDKADGSFVDVNYKGENYLLSSHLVDSRGWKIVTLIDKSVVSTQVRASTDPITYVFLVSLLALIVIVYLLVKYIMFPYGKLVTYGEEVALGHYDHNIPDTLLRRSDELGDLGQSFQSIIDTFRTINNRLEDEIQEKNNQLASQFDLLVDQEKQAALGSLVSGVAHELNTPLGNSLSISTYLKKEINKLQQGYNDHKLKKSDLEKFFSKESESIRLLEASLKEADRIIEMFNMITDCHSEDQMKSFVLKDLLNTLKESKRQDLNEHHINIDCEKDLTLVSSPSAILQILNQLIDNSIKHGFDSQANRIDISVSESNQSISIYYSDYGIGMSEETISKMYDMFYTTNRMQGSVGLGLYMVYNIVSQALNGSIDYIGSVNNGVVFHIKIPAK